MPSPFGPPPLLIAAVAAALSLPAAAPAQVAASFQDAPPVPGGGRAGVAVTGFLETIDEVDLAAERPGVLGTLTVTEGTRVDADQIVAELKDEQIRARLATARLQADDDISERYARRAADVAEADWRSMERANRRLPGAVVKPDVERARLSYEQAKAQIEKAKLDRELAGLQVAELEAELRTYAIAAPFAGVVQRVLKRPGEAVQQSEPVVRLVSTDRLRVNAFVPLADALKLSVGDEAEGRAVLPDLAASDPAPEPVRFAGRVSFIDPSSQRTGDQRVRVYIEVDNRDGRLRGGLNAVVTAYPGTAPNPPGAPGPASAAAR